MTANRLRKTLLIVPLLFTLGCSGGTGSPVRVNGKVSLDGKPLENAMVLFLPEDGNGTPANGTTGSDGSFRLTTYSTGDGARPGSYKVVIQLGEPAGNAVQVTPNDPQANMEAMKKFKAAPKKKGPQLSATYSDPKKTTLKQVVPTNGEVILELRSTGG